MKKTFLFVSIVAGLTLVAGGLFGANAKEVTIVGDGMCAKCALHETASCQTAIATTENGRKVVYYLADNVASKGFHQNVCTASVKITATGTVEVTGGKNVLTASKIELAK